MSEYPMFLFERANQSGARWSGFSDGQKLWLVAHLPTILAGVKEIKQNLRKTVDKHLVICDCRRMSKTDNMTLANKIRLIKKGERIKVGDEKKRTEACKIIKTLRDAGVVTLDLITREVDPGEFYVIAL